MNVTLDCEECGTTNVTLESSGEYTPQVEVCPFCASPDVEVEEH